MSRHIVIVGLGLIGGSMAKALHGFEDFDLIGVDVSEPTLRYALEQDIVDRVEPDPRKALAEGDLVFLCLHPQGIVDFMAEHRDHFKAGAMVTDVCGVKGAILAGARVLPDTVSFVGGHPMAGTEFSLAIIAAAVFIVFTRARNTESAETISIRLCNQSHCIPARCRAALFAAPFQCERPPAADTPPEE